MFLHYFSFTFIFLLLSFFLSSVSFAQVILTEQLSSTFSLAQKYIQDGKYENAITIIRRILSSSPNADTEKQATFLLAKSFLLSKKLELASATFEHLDKNWPDHPWKQEASFLQIERELSSMTRMQNFLNQAESILAQPPFFIDLDFFYFYTGFSKGYQFSDYLPVKKKLQLWFHSEDPELSARARLLDALVESFDFSNPLFEAELESIRSQNQTPFCDIATLALIFKRIPFDPNPKKLKQLITKKPESRPIWIANFVLFQLYAYVHTDFDSAMDILEELLPFATPKDLPILKTHKQLVSFLSQPAKTADEILKKARKLEGYSAWNLAVIEYKKLMDTNINEKTKALACYHLGKIFQDDLIRPKEAEFYFQKSLKLPLPSVFMDEAKWRLLKLQPKERVKKDISAVSISGSPWAEAAILQELNEKNISPDILESYFQSLMKLTSDPSSQMDFLKKLAKSAQENHQYAKARFYLLQLTRFDLDTANLLLKENNAREEMFRSLQEQALSLEPEKFIWERAKLLIGINQKQEGLDLLESLSKKQGLWAEKASFYLFRYKLPPTELDSDQKYSLEQWFEKSKDPQIREEILKLKISDLNLRVAKDNARNSHELKKEVDSLFEKARQDFSHLYPSLALEEIKIYLALGENKDAERIHKQFFSGQDNTQALEAAYQIASSNQNFPMAKQICKQLATVDPIHRKTWLNLAFDFSIQPIQKQTDEAAWLLSFEEFSSENNYETLLEDKIFDFLTTWPENQKGLQLFLSIPDTSTNQERKLKVIQKLLTKDPTNKSVIMKKLQLSKNIPGFFTKSFVFRSLLDPDPDIQIEAALTLSVIAKNDTSVLENAKNPSFRNKALEPVLIQICENRGEQEQEQILFLRWQTLEEDEKRDLLSEEAKRNEDDFRKGWHLNRYLELLAKAKRTDRILEISKEIMSKNFSHYLKYLTLETIFPSLFKTEFTSLRDWSLKIDANLLPQNIREDFLNLRRKVNSRSVIQAIHKSIHWDDPQDPKNINHFFQLANLYENELEDTSSAIHIYNQMKEFFRDKDTASKIQEKLENLPHLSHLYELSNSKNSSDLMKASELWLEKGEPHKALLSLQRAKSLNFHKKDDAVFALLEARILIEMRELDKAKQILKELLFTYEELSVSLMRQINASSQISALPPISRAKPVELFRLGKIYINDFFDLNTADKILSRLDSTLSIDEKKNQLIYTKIHLDYYNVAIAKNEIERGLQILLKVSELSPDLQMRSTIYHVLGNHYTFHKPSPWLARSFFEKSFQTFPSGAHAQLSQLALIDLYEKEGKTEFAIKAVQDLKKALWEPSREKELVSREAGLQKSLVLKKLQSRIDELAPDKQEEILKTARMLAKEPEFFYDAEQKYLLALRLSNEQEEKNTRQELADFYLNHNRFSQAANHFTWLFENEKDHKKSFAAGFQAAKIIGLKLNNFQGSFGLIRKLRDKILNQEQEAEVKNLYAEIQKLKSSKKRITLKNLNYTHLDEIKDIKARYYQNQQYEKAASALEDLLKTTENFELVTGIHYELSRLYDLKIKNLKKALEHYRLFFEKIENDEIASEILLRIAQIEYSELRDYKKALQSYEQFKNRFPSARKRIAVLFEIARILVDHEREFSKALDTYTDISNSYPQTEWDYKAKFLKAELLSAKMSDFYTAIETYRDLIETNLESDQAPEALFRIAKIYDRELNDQNQAITIYQELIRRFPNSSQAVMSRTEIDKISRR